MNTSRPTQCLVISIMIAVTWLGVPLSPSAAADCGDTVGVTPPTKCACGDTLVDDRTFAGDEPITQAPCPGDGLTIGASNVTLDMSGRTIRGRGTGAGIAIDAGVDGVTIKKGKVIGFREGIRSDADTAGSVFTNIQVNGNENFGLILWGNGNLITKMVAERNGLNGVTMFGDHNAVHSNRAEDNGGNGFAVEGEANVVDRNVALRNAGTGLFITGSAARVETNRSSFNHTYGMTINGERHRVARNILLGNAGGIEVTGAQTCVFDRNRTDRNRLFGISDDSVGGTGTSGTKNTYTLNICSNDGFGDSFPAGLCR